MFINNQDYNVTQEDIQKTTFVSDNQNADLMGCATPIMECPRENVCQRDIHHQVEHIVPINTRIINNHIYHHVYKPVYTCCEENICTQDMSCCKF